MISHRLRCIFIHIPRCAGTSIESWIVGDDWWNIDPTTKHLIASQAKALYAKYWDEYYKFSVVRNPYTRLLSCLKHAHHFRLSRKHNGLEFGEYLATFGKRTVLEYDYRFAQRGDLIRDAHRPGQIYGNLLDEPLDFIARFETLDQDMAVVRSAIGSTTGFSHHLEQSAGQADGPRLSANDQARVRTLYADDFRAFGYSLRHRDRLKPPDRS